MNGTKLNKFEPEFNQEDVFSFKDKELKIKRALSLKYILLIICTNILSYLYFSPVIPTSSKRSLTQSTNLKHKRMIISLDLYTPLNQEGLTKVMLFNHQKKIILKEVYIIGQDLSKNELDEGSPRFIVEVHEKDLSLLTQNPRLIFSAYPISATNFTSKTNTKKTFSKRKLNYEIIL